MDINKFMTLYDLVKDRLRKMSRRPSLPPMLRLAAVLCILAHGHSIVCTAWMFRISKEIMYRMIPEVCSIICDVLMPIYVQFPDKNKWLKIMNQYWLKWQFPNCIGALDGKHFRINCPPKSGSVFYNFKKFYSFVMLALCDANYRFTWFNLGDFGSCSDSSIFSYTDLYSKMINNDLDIPASYPLPHTDVNLPLAFVGDEIFPLSNNLLKPYALRLGLTYEQKVFNYRIKRARLTIECAFGILTSKYVILRQPLKFNLPTAKAIVTTTVCLHNFILANNLRDPNKENLVYCDYPEEQISPAVQRIRLSQYFIAPVGAVDWQDGYL